MKRFMLAVVSLLSMSVVNAADQVVDDIIPRTVVTSTFSYVSIEAPASARNKNCLSEFTLSVSSNAIFRILDAGTTIYTVDVTTTSPPLALTPVPAFYRTWGFNDPFCTSDGQAMNFTVLNSTGSPLPMKMSFRGHIRGDKR